MASAASLARHLAASSGSSMVERYAVAWAIIKEDGGAFPSKILPARWKTLAGWMSVDNHSIVVNKGVYNTLDAKGCTTSTARFEASKLEYRPQTDWTTSANPKDNGKRAWPIWSAGPLFRARKLFDRFPCGRRHGSWHGLSPCHRCGTRHRSRGSEHIIIWSGRTSLSFGARQWVQDLAGWRQTFKPLLQGSNFYLQRFFPFRRKTFFWMESEAVLHRVIVPPTMGTPQLLG